MNLQRVQSLYARAVTEGDKPLAEACCEVLNKSEPHPLAVTVVANTLRIEDLMIELGFTRPMESAA